MPSWPFSFISSNVAYIGSDVFNTSLNKIGFQMAEISMLKDEKRSFFAIVPMILQLSESKSQPCEDKFDWLNVMAVLGKRYSW